MSRSKEACLNHPDRFTARKCYYCKAPICTECQEKRYHHLFCGKQHARLWRLGDLWSRYKPTRELLWLGGFILLSNLLMFLLFYPSSSPVSGKITLPTRADSTYMEESWQVHSVQAEVAGRLELSIEGRPNRSLQLVHNGRIVQAFLSGKKGADWKRLHLEPGNNHIAIWAMTADGKSQLVDSFTVFFDISRLKRLRRSIHYFKTTEKRVALTFDGGSSNRGAREILDILKANNVRCTLFLTGRFMEKYPGLVERMLAEGHEIANHTYNHPHATNLEVDGSRQTRSSMTEQRFKNQLGRTDSIFAVRFHQKLKPFWRAPFGEINSEILTWAAESGLRHIGWSARCDSWDWVRDRQSPLYRSAEQIKEHFLLLEKEKGLSGKIILMHLGSERQDDFPYTTLDALIRELKRRGYRFVKISDFADPLS